MLQQYLSQRHHHRQRHLFAGGVMQLAAPTCAAPPLAVRDASQYAESGVARPCEQVPLAVMVPLRTVLVQVVALDAAAATFTTPAVTALTRRSAVQHVLQASPLAAAVPLRTVLVQVVALDAAATTSATPAATALT